MTIKLFNNVQVFRLTDPSVVSSVIVAGDLNDTLAAKPARQPLATELSTYGFIPPTGTSGVYVETVRGRSGIVPDVLIAAKAYKRNLPGKVIKAEVAKRVAEIEREQKRKVYSRERQQIKDDVVQTLLPRAFIDEAVTYALISGSFIYVAESSPKKADWLLSTLREVLGSLPVRPVAMESKPSTVMTHWAKSGSIDCDHLRLGDSFKISGIDGEKNTLSGSGLSVSDEAVEQALEKGGTVEAAGVSARLDRGDVEDTVSFTLVAQEHGFLLKSIHWPESFEAKVLNDIGDQDDERAHYVEFFRASMILIDDALDEIRDRLTREFDGEQNLGTTTDEDDEEELI